MNKYYKPAVLMIVILLTHCKKEEAPVLTTTNISEITISTAKSGGEITSDGDVSILFKGVCWSTEPEPTIDDQKTLNGTGNALFTSNITGLEPAKTYYVRAYATNKYGTGYGQEESFTTEGDLPSAITRSANGITAFITTLEGSVNPNSLLTNVSFEYGTTTDYSIGINGNPNQITGDSAFTVKASLTDLIPNTTYHFRIKAENSLGLVYGDDLTFKTSTTLPVATTKAATSVTAYTSILNGSLDPNNLSTSVIFEYGPSTIYDQMINAVPAVLSGDSIQNAAVALSGLIPNTTYHYRIKAENTAGSSAGIDMVFKTLADVAAITTLPATQISYNTASLNGSVNPRNSPCNVRFEYGTASKIYSAVAVFPVNNITGTSEKAVNVTVSGLSPNTTYYYRIKAENITGVSYGDELTFTTPAAPPEPVINSISATSVKYGGILTINGEHLNSASQILLGNTSSSIVVTPKNYTPTSMEIEVYNQQDPSQLLDFSVFKIGLVYYGGTKWTDQVSIQSSWTKLADFPGEARYKAGGFTLNGKIFLGCGKGNGSVLNDFWRYDPGTETWTRKTDFPGSGRIYAVGVASSDYGYMGAGHSADNSSKVQLYDFYKYNATTNTWSAIPDYPDLINNFFFNYTVTVNDHAYVSLSNTVAKFREIISDLWVERTSVAELMELPTNSVFAIGNSFYVVSGYKSGSSSTNRSVWEYNTVTSTWTRKADFPGAARNTAVFFSVGNYGYAGCGSTYYTEQFSDMWRYDPAKDKWIRIEDFPAGVRSHAVSFSAGNSGYVGLGVNLSGPIYYKDFWRFDP